MKIIISPAKKMNDNVEALEYQELPHFIAQADELREKMRQLSIEEAKKLWGCNDKLTEQNYQRFQKMSLCENLTPAILAYEGIQYQYMAPAVFENNMLDYIQNHLCILSGFYGVLRPMDGVTPYRLEMQAKLPVQTHKNLYEYWGAKLYENLVETEIEASKVTNKEGITIINLASKEYAQCIERYLRAEDTFITCIFGEMINGKVAQKGTYAKMARGEMVRYMAEYQIEDCEDIKGFNRLGYTYKKELSDENSFVFIK